MTLIDDRGRLFGRFNVIDMALVAFVLVLVPMAYTTARLFRARAPQIERVEPATQAAGARRRIRLVGRDFRPYLRVFVSPTGKPYSLIGVVPDGREGTVALESPTVLDVLLPDLAAGAYDLYLYDETQEIARRPGAFQLTSPPILQEVVEAKIRFSVTPELGPLVNAGDVDLLEEPVKPDAGLESAARAAVLKTVSPWKKNAPEFQVRRPDGPGWAVFHRDDEVIDADVTIPARQNPFGVWQYGGQKIRAGEFFTFQTAQYTMRGVINSISISQVSAVPK